MLIPLIFLSVLFVCFASLSYAHNNDINKNKKEEEKTNVILLMADDLGYGDVGFTGNETIRTPKLDEMASSGVTFNHFYAAAPLCSPTRASCLTGRNPFRQGIFAAHTAGMRSAETTIAEILNQHGYQNGFFGKWHLGWVRPDETQQRGFYSPPWHHGYDEAFCTKSAVPTWNPTQTPPGWTSWNARQDGSWGGSVYVRNGEPVTENLSGDDSRIIMDRAIPFIEKALEKEDPFFATIWFHTPHVPVFAGPKHLEMYSNDLSDKQRHLYGAITAMDEQIGRLRDFLKEKGVAENTIVFFCSDNGPAGHLTERGIASAGSFRGHKHEMWEGGIRVPSLVEWPGHIPKGEVCSVSAGTVDYLPTILDALDLPPFTKNPIDGISLMPVIRGEVTERDVPLAFGYQRLYQDLELYAFIEDGYKICIPTPEEGMMLFNLENDPGESKDLSTEKPGLKSQMVTKLDSIKQSWENSREGMDYAW
jgi:arylsulfatase A-like enzyme